MKFGFDRLEIQPRMRLLALVPCAFASVLLTTYFTVDKVSTLEAGFRDLGEATAWRLASSSDLSLYAGDVQTLSALARDTLAQAHVVSVEISNGAGTLVKVHAGAAPVRHARTFDAEVRIRPTRALNDVGSQPADGKPIGTVHIQIEAETLYRQELTSVLIGLALGAGTLLIATLVAGRMARDIAVPLRRLAETVAAIRGGDLSARSRLRREDELGRFSTGIDDMADTLMRHRGELQSRLHEATRDAVERLRQAEQANAAKARFLAAASHDLRQPLHAVGMFVATLRASATAEQEKIVANIDEGLSAMSNLLGALLEISRLDARVVEPDKTVFALERLFADTGFASAPLAAATGTRLELRARGLHVNTDAALFGCILSNLLNNALQYAQGGCVLAIARRRGDKVRIEVRDDGIGIAPLYHERIFDEFFQIDNPERDRTKGLGLGLAICARAARLLGTRIEIRSALGRGTAFAFELPLGRAEHIRTEAAPAAPAQPKGRVLVVDDDGAIRSAAQGLMQQWGMQVTLADAVQPAIDLIGSQPPFDYLLSDLQLESADDGWDLIAAARRMSPQTRLLLTTGDTSPDTLRRARECDVVVLNKPVTPAKLRAVLSARSRPQPVQQQDQLAAS